MFGKSLKTKNSLGAHEGYIANSYYADSIKAQGKPVEKKNKSKPGKKEKEPKKAPKEKKNKKEPVEDVEESADEAVEKAKEIQKQGKKALVYVTHI